MTSEPLTHVAAEVEVFEQEAVRLGEVVAVANLGRLRLPSHHNLKVHHLSCLRLLHFHGPRAWLQSNLFESLLLSFAHLKLERLFDKVKQTRALASTLASFLLLARLCSLLDRVHVLCLGRLYELKVFRGVWVRGLRFEEVPPKAGPALLLRPRLGLACRDALHNLY